MAMQYNISGNIGRRLAYKNDITHWDYTPDFLDFVPYMIEEERQKTDTPARLTA